MFFGTYYWRNSSGSYHLPLTETSTPGVYTASWDAINYYYNPPLIMENSTYTISVIDSANNQLPTTGQITIAGVSKITAVPMQFNPAAGEDHHGHRNSDCRSQS